MSLRFVGGRQEEGYDSLAKQSMQGVLPLKIVRLHTPRIPALQVLSHKRYIVSNMSKRRATSVKMEDQRAPTDPTASKAAGE